MRATMSFVIPKVQLRRDREIKGRHLYTPLCLKIEASLYVDGVQADESIV